jgi:hypothetical protein
VQHRVHSHLEYTRKDALVLELQTERVLVVPTALFHRLGHFQGFSSAASHYLEELLRPQNTSFRPRHEVEEDPGFKQLIPYVIFRWAAVTGPDHLFAYTRGKGQGESRLHSKRSIGVTSPSDSARLPFVIHHQNLTQAGIHNIQNANLGALAADKVWLSCTIILPLRSQGASGSPVRPVAVGVAVPR